MPPIFGSPDRERKQITTRSFGILQAYLIAVKLYLDWDWFGNPTLFEVGHPLASSLDAHASAALGGFVQVGYTSEWIRKH
jgi:hypothetical protein